MRFLAASVVALNAIGGVYVIRLCWMGLFR